MVRSLVTGGAGFIGSHVAKHCLTLGQEVVVLDDLSGGFRDQVPEGALFVEGSITDNNLVEKLFATYRFQYVYHLAAYAAEGLSHFIRHFNYTNNVIGSINLINSAVKFEVKGFVFTSSIAVYGNVPPPVNEDHVPSPIDPYGIAKYAVELDLKAANDLFELPFIIFRPHNVYGEHQNIGDRYRNVIGIFMNQTMLNKPLTVFGDGTQTRAFSYIDDVAPLIAKSVHVPEAFGKVINIGADQPYKVNDLVAMIGKVFNKESEVRYLPARHEAVDAYADHSKMKEIFQPSTYVELEEGLRRMAEWAQKTGARQTPKHSHVEIVRNLPEIWKE